MQNNQSDLQSEVKKYFQDNNIEEIVSDMLNSLAHSKVEHPIIFMIKHLSLLCKNEDLQKKGILIDHNTSNDQILALNYPEISQDCVFKQVMSQDMFYQIKNNGNNPFSIRQLIQNSVQNQNHKVNVFAPCHESYEAFDIFFKQVKEALNPDINQAIFQQNFDFKYEKKKGPLTDIHINNEIFQYIDKFQIKVNRNIKGFQFNSALNNNERAQIAKHIQNALKSQFQFVNIDIKDLSSQQIKDLIEQNILNKQFSFNKNGSRWPDWPNNRNLMVIQDKKLAIWINKEDHLQLIVNSQKKSNVIQEIGQWIEYLDKLDQQLSFSFSDEFGYTCVKPQKTGTGIKLSMIIKFPKDKMNFIKNIKECQQCYPQFEIINEENKQILIKMKQQLKMQQDELPDILRRLLVLLFKNIIQEYSDPLIKNNHELKKIQETLVINDLIQTHNTVEKSFFVLKRNLKNVLFQPKILKKVLNIQKLFYFYHIQSEYIQSQDISQIDDIFQKFVKNLSYQYLGDFFQYDSTGFNECLVKIKLTFDLNEENIHGISSIYVSENMSQVFLANYEDHFTILFNLNGNIVKLKDQLEQLIYIDFKLQEAMVNVARCQDNRFITSLHKSGSGLSFYCYLKQENFGFKDFQQQSQDIFEIDDQNSDILKCKQLNVDANKLDLFLIKIRNLILKEKNNKLMHIKWNQKTVLSQFSSLILKVCQNIQPSCGLSVLDCIHEKSKEIIALNQEQYQQYINIYSEFVKFKESQIINKNFQFSFPKYDGLEKIKFEIGRNVEQYQFSKFMSLKETQEFETQILSAAKAYYQGFVKYRYHEIENINTKMTPQLDQIPQQTFILVHKDQQYALWFLADDHIRAVCTATQSNFEQSFHQIMEFLRHLEYSGFTFSYSERLGYLAEKAVNLGFNMKYMFKIYIPNQKLKEIESFLNKHQYKYTSHKELSAHRFVIKLNKIAIIQNEKELINQFFQILQS